MRLNVAPRPWTRRAPRYTIPVDPPCVLDVYAELLMGAFPVSPRVMTGLVVALTAAIVLLEIAAPLGVAPWILYLVPLALSAQTEGRVRPLHFALLATLLTAVGIVFPAAGAVTGVGASLQRRAFGAIALLVVGWLLEHRLRAEAALRESEARLRTILDTEPECVKLFRPDGTLLEMNPAGLQVIEADSLEQVRGAPLYPLVVPEQRAAAEQVIARAVGGEEGRIEFELIGLKGAHRWLEMYVSPQRDASGAVTAVLGISRDVTRRREVEQELRDREEHLRLFIEHAPAALAMFDREMRYVAASERWVSDNRLGDTPLLGRSHYDVSPDIPEAWRAVHRRALAGEVVRADRDHFVRADGRELWLHWEVRPWRVRGEIGGIVIFTEDITESVRTRSVLEASERRFRAMFERSSVPTVLVTAQEFRFVDVNEAWVRLLGWSREELIGQTGLEFGLVADPARRSRAIDEFHRTGVMRDTEFVLRTKAGELLTVLGSHEAVGLDDGAVQMFCVRDITAQRRAELDSRLLVRRLLGAEDAERRRIARELHDSTAQDLVAISLTLAAERDRAAAQGGERLAAMDGALDTLERAANDIRTLAFVLHPPYLEDEGIASAVRHYAHGFGARTGIAVSVDVAGAAGRFEEVVEIVIFRVLQECLANIHRHAGSPTASVRLAREDDALVLEVRDAGHGMRSVLEEVPDDVVEGSGMGLRGMRARLGNIGGSLDVVSGSEGTLVRAVLPEIDR